MTAPDDGATVEIEHGVRVTLPDGPRVVACPDSEAAAKAAASFLALPAETVTREVRREPWQSDAERAAVDALLAPGNTREGGPW